jgi:GntR family transcriptional repressor for pyruvate dehydrogenase complex
MNQTSADLESHVLELLERNPQGVGSGSLLLHLLDTGIEVSQPTVSRLLKSLDHRGLTHKVSNKGRALTAQGISWLEQTRHRRQRVRWVERIMAAVEPSTLEELRDVLVARRALEHEIARLAADHATAEQIAEMREVVEQQKREIESSAQSNSAALNFHRLLAQACSNSFLALASDVLRNERHVLEVIMYHLGSTVGGESQVSHAQILDAVAARDRFAAGRAMTRHMDQYIRYVDHLRAQPRPVRLVGSGSPTLEPSAQESELNGLEVEVLLRGGL